MLLLGPDSESGMLAYFSMHCYKCAVKAYLWTVCRPSAGARPMHGGVWPTISYLSLSVERWVTREMARRVGGVVVGSEQDERCGSCGVRLHRIWNPYVGSCNLSRLLDSSLATFLAWGIGTKVPFFRGTATSCVVWLACRSSHFCSMAALHAG